MTIPTSPGKLIAIACFLAAIAKLTGIVAIKFSADTLFLASIAAAMVLP